MKKTRPSEAVRRLYQALNAAFGDQGVTLTLPQGAILRVLLEQGPLYQRQITLLTGMDRSTLSALLTRLATLGFVAAARFEEDKRAVMITLTPAGRKTLQKADAALVQAEAKMLALIATPDRQAFLRALQGMGAAKK